MTFWIRNGQLIGRLKRADGSDYSDKAMLEHFNAVKISVQADCTHVQWHMGGANWSSLMFAASYLRVLPSPYRMQYFNMGWIEETAPSVEAVALRIEQLIAKSDVHFSQRIYTLEIPPDPKLMPETLRTALETGDAQEEISVICNVDAARQASHVTQVGDKSLVASIWGVSQVSFPCLSGNSYDRVVSKSYFEAVQRDRPVYDHVLAVMVKPDGEHHWMGYQRLVIPQRGTGTKRDVKVVSAMAPVDISLL